MGFIENDEEVTEGKEIKFYSTTYETIPWLGKYVASPIDADIIVFTGGSDISPEIYHHKRISKTTGVQYLRDKREIAIFNMFKNKPKLGICRGHQLLSALGGATLFQDVNNHYTSHKIRTWDGMEFMTTSCHHQMVNLIDVEINNYFLLGWSEALSTTYIDQTNDEVRIGTKLLTSRYMEEPEILFWPDMKAVTTQGHPKFYLGLA